MSGPIRSYRDLLVWQKAMDLAVIILKLAERLKKARSYAVANQLERAAVSIPSNLAEGHGRRSRAEFRRFIAVANASLRELETQLELLSRHRPKLSPFVEKVLSRTDEIGRMLNGLYRRLELPPRSQRVGGREQGADSEPP